MILLWGPDEDIPTALETVEERMQLAFTGVPNETRKSFPDGTTMFERVLPGRDRMYPDTDSAPIPLHDSKIEELRSGLPQPVSERIKKMTEWGIPVDSHRYILSKNLYPLIVSIADDFGFSPRETGIFLGHRLKHIEGTMKAHEEFTYDIIHKLFGFIKDRNLRIEIAEPMLRVLYEHPKMRFESILTTLNYKKKEMEEILSPIDFLYDKFMQERVSNSDDCAVNWLMGQVRKQATGNVSLAELRKTLEKRIKADD
jgi:glutamyl-tRNA(Gln) amidotransferase subunit E